MSKVKCFCKICGKYIGEYYPSVTRDSCSLECKRKLIGLKASGVNNPNYKHGRYIENRCKTCNKLIDPRSIYCHKCRPRLGHIQSEETKRKIGLASKKKFTKEYREKIKIKHSGNRKRAINGYILIKDYNHPDRNSQNDILEHRLVMSKFLKRSLMKDEIVHHIDFDRSNNEISNLYLYKNRGEHLRAISTLFKLVKELLISKIISFENGEYKKNI